MAKNKIKAAESLETLKITWLAVDVLKPNDYNPNRQNPADFDLLLASMEEDGFTQPIVALKDGTIVDGEHRWRAAKQLNLAKVPVVVLQMTPEQAKVATLRHNRARGSEDFGLTVDVMRDLQKLGAIEWAQDSLRLSDEDMNLILQDSEQTAAEAIGAKAESWSQAWEPIAPTQSSEHVSREGTSLVVASKKTEEAVQQRLIDMRNATTAQERLEASRSVTLFRVSMRYKGEDAMLVRSILVTPDTDPGDKMVDICRRFNKYQAAENKE